MAILTKAFFLWWLTEPQGYSSLCQTQAPANELEVPANAVGRYSPGDRVIKLSVSGSPAGSRAKRFEVKRYG